MRGSPLKESRLNLRARNEKSPGWRSLILRMSGFSDSACRTDLQTDPARTKKGCACRAARTRTRMIKRRRSRNAAARISIRPLPPGCWPSVTPAAGLDEGMSTPDTVKVSALIASMAFRDIHVVKFLKLSPVIPRIPWRDGA